MVTVAGFARVHKIGAGVYRPVSGATCHNPDMCATKGGNNGVPACIQRDIFAKGDGHIAVEGDIGGAVGGGGAGNGRGGIARCAAGADG